MSYCINPNCSQRQNSDNAEICQGCGTSLVIHGRIRLVKPLRLLSDNLFYASEIFEIDDEGSEWHYKDEWQNRRIMKVLSWRRPELLALFKREARVLRRIKHPRIPKSTIDDYFSFTPTTCPELYCLVMQKIEGENLDDWIQRYGRISHSQALKWLKQLFEILDFVHEAGYFHRDIKPSNIVIQPDGQLALIDFGGVREVTETYLAKLRGRDEITYENTAIHTPRFSPLEQVEGRAVPQSDFFAVGRTFVYCVTGHELINLPIDQKTGRLIWRDKARQIDQPLADFIDELMAPLPAKRPQTTQIILQRLEGLPFRSKVHRLVRSKPFQVGALLFSFLAILGLYKGATYSISNFYFNQASRNEDRPEIAKKNYELAIKFNPDDFYAYNNLALVCQRLQDNECASRNLKLLISKRPDIWQAYHALGSFYDNLGKYNLAEQQYRIASKVAQKNNTQAVQSINNLSRLYILKRDYQAAIDLASQGLKFAETPQAQAALYKNLGWAEFEQAKSQEKSHVHKSYQRIKDTLTKSKNLDPDRTDTWCLLAQTQEILGDIKQAQISWEVCLVASANSNLPEIQRWRQKILQRLLPQ